MTLRNRLSLSRRARYRLGAAVPAGIVLALLAALSPAARAHAARTAPLQSNCSQHGDSVTYHFRFPGGPQLFTVPAGWSWITVIADGAAGGTGSSSPGGDGAEAQACFAVTPAEPVEVMVGGQGAAYYISGTGGFNGGGDAGRGAQGAKHSGVDGGGGGGASDVRFGACASTLSCGLADRALVAGGGGGSVGAVPGQGGFGGAPSGGPGDSGGTPNGGRGGGGGGQAGGGAGGAADPNSACAQHAAGGADGGTPARDHGGAGGSGGVIYPDTNSANGGNGGGGGGGGYWGGGGGGGACGYSDTPGAGGGGSSYGPPGATFTNNTWSGDGQVTIIDSTPRDAPAIGHVIRGDSAARVTFTPPAAGAPVISYTATAIDRTDPDRGGQTATGPGSPLTVTGLTNGDSYAFTVTATTSGGVSPPSAASDPVTPNPLVYVANLHGDSVTEYASGVTGDAEPFATLSVPGGPISLALDPAGDLWVTEFDNSVAEYAKGAAGDARPVRTIAGNNTRLEYPTGLALDTAGDVWVGNINPFGGGVFGGPGLVTEYAAGADGNIKPITTIEGTGTNVNGPSGVAVDRKGHVWVSNLNSSTVTEYAVGANGGAQLIATIGGSNTGIHDPEDVALDQTGNVWVSNNRGSSGTGTGDGSVTEYAAGAAGDIHPINIISGSAPYPYGLALDSAGHVFVVSTPINGSPEPGVAAVAEYATAASGPPSLIAKIQGRGTGLDLSYGIAVAGAAPGPRA